MNKFRIKINLSAFFDDERKLVYMLVDPTWDNVLCLQRRVEQMFELENVLFITEEGCFVPPQESIEVIKSHDLLKAFTGTKSLTKQQKKSKKSTNLAIDILPEIVAANVDEFERKQLKKRKYYSLETTGFASSTPNHAKRSKNAALILESSPTVLSAKTTTSNEITSTNEHLGNAEKQSINYINIVPIENKTEEISEEQQNVPVEKSKKRKRQKKKTSFMQTEEQHNSVEHITTDVIHTKNTVKLRSDIPPSSTFLNDSNLSLLTTNKSPLSPSITSNKAQTFYNNTSETVTTTATQNNLSAVEIDTSATEKSVPKVIFSCPIDHIQTNKPRGFALKQIKSADISTTMCAATSKAKEVSKSLNESKAEKPTIIVQEHIVILPEKSAGSQLNLKIGGCSDEPTTSVTITESRDQEFTFSDECQISKIGDNETNATIIEPSKQQTTVTEECKISSNETNAKTTHSETKDEEITTLADDSSIIAIESEDDDDDIDFEPEGENDNDDCSEVIDLNASDEDLQQNSFTANFKNRSSMKKRTSAPKLTIANMLPFSTMLDTLPASGDIVIFKILRSDRKCSGFIAGKCKYTNKRIKDMKILVIDGHSEINDIPYKFICSFDDSRSTEKQYLKIKMTDMIDARLFSTS